MSNRLRGMLLAAGGASIFSFDPLLIRLQALSPAGVVFWRSLFSGIAFAALAVLARKAIQPDTDPWRRNWVPMAQLVVLLVLGNTMFVFSLTHTAVAQTLVIVASVPIATGILGHFALREHLPARTWFAGAAVLAGVLLVVLGSLGTVDLEGDMWALGNTAVSAVLLVSLRRYPSANRLVALSASAFAAAILVAPWAQPLPDLKTAIASSVDGLFIVPGGLLLTSLAPRYLPAAEVGLLLLMETILGPLWVFLAVAEVPTLGVALSAAIVLGALATHSWLELRDERPVAAEVTEIA